MQRPGAYKMVVVGAYQYIWTTAKIMGSLAVMVFSLPSAQARTLTSIPGVLTAQPHMLGNNRSFGVHSDGQMGRWADGQNMTSKVDRHFRAQHRRHCRCLESLMRGSP